MDTSPWTGRAPSAVTSAAACGLSTMRIFCPANWAWREQRPDRQDLPRLARDQPDADRAVLRELAEHGRGHRARGHPLAGRDRGHREGSHQRLESGHAHGRPVTGRLVGEAHPPGPNVRREPCLVDRLGRVVGFRVDGDLQRSMRKLRDVLREVQAVGIGSVGHLQHDGLRVLVCRARLADRLGAARGQAGQGRDRRHRHGQADRCAISVHVHRLPAPHLPAIRAGTEPVIRAGTEIVPANAPSGHERLPLTANAGTLLS